MFDSWLQDLRYAVRLLRRNPLFALTAVLSLAIGIGANTTIFTIANALLFKPPLGVADASRLVDVGRSQDGQGFDNGSYSNYLDIRARNTVFSGIYAYRLGPEPMSLRGKDGAERIYGEMVSTNYFNVLGTPPHIGRLFTSDDSEQPGATPLAVLSHRFWMRRFNGDPAIVGQTLVLNGRPLTVIGVTPEGFHGTTVLTSDLWVPVNMVGELASRLPPAILTSRESAWLVMGARLKPGVTVGQAQAELANIGRALEQEFPDANRGKGLRVVASSPVPGDGAPVAAFMAVLMAIVMLVLAIACANVAGVLLARATTRRREIAVRLAIGAGRGRLIRQMLVESTLLFLIGGSGGLVLARLMTGALLSLLPAVPLPIDVTLALDGRAVVFTLTLSLVAAILSGLAPAFHASRAEVVGALKSDTQGGPERIWLRHAFVVSQVALSIVLVVGAGLFARALQRASEIDPGFDPHGVELATLDLSLGGYTADTGRVFARELIRRVRETPGVQAAALSAVMPLGDRGIGLGGLAVPGVELRNGRRFFDVDWNVITPGYFATMKMALSTGRDFSDADREGTPSVVIVNETAARQWWPRQDALGKTLLQETGRPDAPDAVRQQVPEPGRRSAAVRLRADSAAVYVTHCYRGAVGARSAPRRAASSAPRLDEPESSHRASAHLRRLLAAGTASATHRGVGRRQPRTCRRVAGGNRDLRRDGLHGVEPHARDRHSDGAWRRARVGGAHGAAAGADADDDRRGHRPGGRRRGKPPARLAALRRWRHRSVDLHRIDAAIFRRRCGGVLRAGTARHRYRRDGRPPIRLGTIAPVRETTSAAAMHL
jgi:predicted permease